MALTTAKTVIGMDVGKRYSWCQAIDSATGEIMRDEKLANEPEEFEAFVKNLPTPILLVMEATGNWQYLYDCWEELADEIQMAHPLEVKAIAEARIKTDKRDAGTLAHLGLANLIPQAYCPPRPVRDLREILRHRAFMVRLQTRVKNRIHSYLGKLGIQSQGSDLFGRAGLKWLAEVEWREPYRDFLNQDLKILETLQEQIKKATHTIEALAEEDPKVSFLLPIRGIGKYSALLILSEIGDIHRFADPKKLVSYAGLCPSTFQSGQVLYHGKITKQGSKWLRWIMIEAAQRYAKAPGRLGSFFRRLERKKGSKTARTALARKLLHAIYHCLKKGVAFEENPMSKEKVSVQHAPQKSGR